MIKYIERYRKLLNSLLILILCVPLISCSSEDHSMVSCPYPLKQLYMYDDKTGWGLSMENEILFTENGIENLKPINKIENANSGSDLFTNAVFMDEQTAYITYFSSDNEHLIIEHTRDGGANWQQTLIRYSDYADAGSAFLSFSDDKEGYLLYCSTSACGLMSKFLFVTDDAGETFTFAENLTNTIAGYPQGITAVSREQINIAVTYHGIDNYLYQSHDSGKTWDNIEIFSRTDDVNYVDGYAPIFYSNDRQKGILILKVMRENAVYELYTTNNGGSWSFDRELPCGSLLSYSISGDGQIYIIDQSGNLISVIPLHSLQAWNMAHAMSIVLPLRL